MAHTINTYQEGMKYLLGAGNVLTDTIVVSLFGSGYAPNYQTDKFVTSFAAQEINAGAGDTNGYYAGHGQTGRHAFTTPTLAASASGLILDAADLTWTALAAALADIYGAVIHTEGTSDDTDAYALWYVDFDPVFDPSGSDFLLQWNASGIVKIGDGTVT